MPKKTRRPRCKLCDKVSYPTAIQARQAIASIPLHSAYMKLKPYQCPAGKWHVGHDIKMLWAFSRPQPAKE